MKVKFIKNKIENPAPKLSNADMTEYYKVGTIFWVYGIEIEGGDIYCYIFDDYHLVPIPLEMFEILDNTLPSIWKFKRQLPEVVYIWPDLFDEERFLDNFSDYQKIEREKFENIRKFIEI